MTLALGSHGLGNNTFTSSTSTPAKTTQATGSTFVVPIQANRAADPNPIVSVTDTVGGVATGNTYTSRTADNPGYGGDINCAAWACENGVGGANHVVTVTFSEQCTNNVDLIELLGVSTSGSAADGVAATSGGGTAGTSQPGPALTTTNANDIIVSWLATYGFNTGTITITSNTGAGWAGVDQVVVGTTSRHCASSYLIVSSIGTYNDTYTSSSSDGYSALTLAFKAASGGGGVTVALTGQAATFAAGAAAPSTSKALTGQGATFAAGTVSPGLSKALTGTAITSATGTVSPSSSIAMTGQGATFSPGTMSAGGNVTVALTGQSATFSAGAIAPSASLALLGGSASFAAGNLLAAHSQALTGSAITSAPGSLAPSSSVALTGISATFAAGTLTPLSPNVTVALTGQAAVFSAGTLAPSSTVALTGSISNSATGTVTPLSGVVVALTGASAVFTAGQLGLVQIAVPYVINLPLGSAANLLNSNTLQVGALTYQNSAVVTLGSVIAQSPAAGTLVLENSQVALLISSGFATPTNDPVSGIKLPNLPNKILPPDNALVDTRGVIATNWWRFLLNVSNQALGTNQTVPATVNIGSSPYVFTTPAQGTLLVAGGPVTLIEYSKDGVTWYPTGVTQGQVQMVPNDHVRITYMNAPTLTFFPR